MHRIAREDESLGSQLDIVERMPQGDGSSTMGESDLVGIMYFTGSDLRVPSCPIIPIADSRYSRSNSQPIMDSWIPEVIHCLCIPRSSYQFDVAMDQEACSGLQ